LNSAGPQAAAGKIVLADENVVVDGALELDAVRD